MHRHLPSPGGAILAAILGQFGTTQSAAEHAMAPALSFAVAARAVGLDTVDGVPWATGPGYKASFTAAGMTFIPALRRQRPAAK